VLSNRHRVTRASHRMSQLLLEKCMVHLLPTACMMVPSSCSWPTTAVQFGLLLVASSVRVNVALLMLIPFCVCSAERLPSAGAE
jgi:hypothetical protein